MTDSAMIPETVCDQELATKTGPLRIGCGRDSCHRVILVTCRDEKEQVEMGWRARMMGWRARHCVGVSGADQRCVLASLVCMGMSSSSPHRLHRHMGDLF
jgi:hypothetical protein